MSDVLMLVLVLVAFAAGGYVVACARLTRPPG
jgi:hypothetical protein